MVKRWTIDSVRRLVRKALDGRGLRDAQILKVEWLSTEWCTPRMGGAKFKIARATVSLRGHQITKQVTVEQNGEWMMR